MATQNQIVYDIAETIGAAEDPIMLARLALKVQSYRSLLLRRDAERTGLVPRAALQTLKCVEMERVSASGLPGMKTDKVTRSKKRLPQTVNLKGSDGIQAVKTIDGRRTYGRIQPAQVAYVEFSRYASKRPSFYFKDGYLYIHEDFPQMVDLEAAFEDPTELARWKDCSGKAQYDPEQDYPVPADMVQRITQSILSEITPSEDKQVEIND